MTDLLALLWDRRRWGALAGNASDPAPRVVAAGSQSVPADQLSADVASWAQWVAGAVPRGTESLPWVVVLPREDVIQRHLELPDAPDDELPDLVKFQASMRSTLPLDSAALDFLPLPKLAESTQRDVVSFTCSTAVLSAIQQSGQRDAKPVACVTVSSAALAEFIVRIERSRKYDAHGISLLVALQGTQAEYVVVGDRQLWYGHASRLPEALSIGATDSPGSAGSSDPSTSDVSHVPSAVLAEASRTVIAVQRMRPQMVIHRIWLLGGNDMLAAALTERLGAATERLSFDAEIARQPLLKSLAAKPLTAATLLGALQLQSSSSLSRVDLLHPRQPPAKRDPRKQQLAIGSAAGLAIVFLIGAIWQLWVGGLDRDIARLTARQTDLDDRLKIGQPTLVTANAVSDWSKRDVGQLQQLTQLEALLPGDRERPFLSSYEYVVSTGPNAAKLEATGAARTRNHVEELKQALVDDKSYQVKPTDDKVHNDPDYRFGFSLDLDVLLRRPNSTAGTKPNGKASVAPAAQSGSSQGIQGTPPATNAATKPTGTGS
jgi:hypothetical protein